MYSHLSLTFMKTYKNDKSINSTPVLCYIIDALI